MTLYRQGALEEAIVNWKKIREGSAQFATAQNDLAAAYILRKQFNLAEAALGKALHLEPGNVLFNNNLKWLNSEMKRK